MPLIPQTQKMLVGGLALLAIIVTLALWNIIPDASGYITAILMFILAIGLFLETYIEEGLKFPPKKLGDIFVTMLIILTVIFGVVSLLYGAFYLPLPLKGVMGTVTLFDIVGIVYEAL